MKNLRQQHLKEVFDRLDSKTKDELDSDLFFLVQEATYTDAEIEEGRKVMSNVDYAAHLLSKLVEKHR
jgi:hypothetical protein